LNTVTLMARDSIGSAWLIAATELSIRVEVPGNAEIGGARVACEVYLPDFGSPHGMAVFGLRVSRRGVPRDPILELSRRPTDPYYSQVSNRAYGHFDREHFIEALKDWGWFGEGEPPDWYTGAPRSE
jgi:hypothetical protein